MIVDPLRVLSRRSLGDAGVVDELLGEPEAGRGGAEEVEVLTEAVPDTPVVRLDGGAVDRWHTQILHRDPLAVEHPEDVMVGDDKQLGRRPQGGTLVRKQRRGDVAVGPDYR